MKHPARFYVYTLSRPNGSVFYVGKGTGRRIDAHAVTARKGHNCPKCSIIRKIWREGGEFIKQIVLWTDDEQAALDYEVALIREYGRESLANQTDGGGGMSGWKPTFTPQHRERIRIAQTGRKYTAEAKAKIGAASRGRVHSAATLAKLSASMKRVGNKPPSQKGKPLSAEHKARISAAQTGKPKPKWSAETRAKLTPIRQEQNRRPEVRAKFSAMFKGRPATAAAVAVVRKLTMQQAGEIRALYASGQFSQEKLARMFGVDNSCISRIVTGKIYRG